MFFFNRIPLFRLFLAFITGIIAGVYICEFIIHPSLLSSVLVAILVLSLLLILLYKNPVYSKRWVFGVALHTFLLSAGFLLALIKTERLYPNHLSGIDWNPRSYLVKVVDDGSQKSGLFKFKAQLVSYFKDGKQEDVNGIALFYMQKDSTAPSIHYGDILLIDAALKPVNGPQNPAQFNYKQFLSFRQITRETYLLPQSIKVLNVNMGNPLMKWVYGLRKQMLAIFKTHGLRGKEFAVGAALILGYTDELDAELLRSYAGSGALHVLAVSGLHVGIMYMVAFYLLAFLDKVKHGSIIKALLLLAFLALYAMITGLSPSVLRASVMFGFVAVAKGFNRHSSILNTVVASAIFLLLYDPYLITQVGFQLSYLAVIGILIIQPLLADNWYPKYRLTNWLWQITCVSVAAQLVTGPLSLFYFHQFPVYFMLSNLVVIPLAAVILYLGIATLVSSVVPVVCTGLTFVLKWVIWLLNWSVAGTSSLPHSAIGRIDINFFEALLFYSLLIALLVFFTKRRMAGLYVALVSLLLICISQFTEAVQQTYQESFTVYNVKGSAVYDITGGRQNQFYAPTALLNNKKKMLHHIEPNWWKNGVEVHTLINLDSLNTPAGIISFYQGNKRIVVIGKNFNANAPYTNKLNADIVVLSGNTSVNIDHIKKYFKPERVVFDSSNSTKLLVEWNFQCKVLGIACYNVAEEGAFVAEL